MKTKVVLRIDIQSIAKQIMEDNKNGNYSSISYTVQNEIKQMAVDQVKRKILEAANVEELVKADYGKQYITRLAQDTIAETLRTKTQEYINQWITNNLKNVIDRALRETLDKLLLPKLNKMIANLLVVDQEQINEEIAEMEKALHDEANTAFQQGLEQGERGR